MAIIRQLKSEFCCKTKLVKYLFIFAYALFPLTTLAVSVCLLLVCIRAATGAVLEIRLKFCNCISFAYFSVHLFLVCIALHCICCDFIFPLRALQLCPTQNTCTHTHTHSPFFRSIVVRIPFSHFPYVLAFFNLHYDSFGKVKFDVRKARDKHFSVDLLSHSHSLTHSLEHF